MNSPKMREAMNHRSVSLHTTQRSVRAQARSEGNGFSRINSELLRGAKLSFAEDFNLEHSLAGATITVIAISASGDSAGSSAPGSPYARDLTSPNCVYLG